MSNAITMGILWHLIGAASAACFYAPFKKVRHWSWETMWSVGGVVSWLILPWVVSALLLPDLWAYYRSFSAATLLPVFLFGAMWGIGNINYGLTMRYLGMSMGIGIAIGITLIVGTLMTPLLNGKFGVLVGTAGGRMTLLGVFVALVGVAIVTRAGQLKERQMGIKAEEFNLKKGRCWRCCAACSPQVCRLRWTLRSRCMKPLPRWASIRSTSRCQAMSLSWAAVR